MTQKDFEALCRRLNPSPWQQSVLYEELVNPWHTGTPTEEGWYLVWMGEIKGNTNERPDVMLFENGDWASRLVANTYVAWQKIEPYEASKERE